MQLPAGLLSNLANMQQNPMQLAAQNSSMLHGMLMQPLQDKMMLSKLKALKMVNDLNQQFGAQDRQVKLSQMLAQTQGLQAVSGLNREKLLEAQQQQAFLDKNPLFRQLQFTKGSPLAQAMLMNNMLGGKLMPNSIPQQSVSPLAQQMQVSPAQSQQPVASPGDQDPYPTDNIINYPKMNPTQAAFVNNLKALTSRKPITGNPLVDSTIYGQINKNMTPTSRMESLLARVDPNIPSKAQQMKVAENAAYGSANMYNRYILGYASNFTSPINGGLLRDIYTTKDLTQLNPQSLQQVQKLTGFTANQIKQSSSLPEKAKEKMINNMSEAYGIVFPIIQSTNTGNILRSQGIPSTKFAIKELLEKYPYPQSVVSSWNNATDQQRQDAAKILSHIWDQESKIRTSVIGMNRGFKPKTLGQINYDVFLKPALAKNKSAMKTAAQNVKSSSVTLKNGRTLSASQLARLTG